MRPLLLALLLPGCIDTSPDRVKLTGELHDVSLEVRQELLATGLSGGFSLELTRGDLSESGATVQRAPTFTLLAAGGGAQVVTLDALPDPPLPWSVNPDQSRTIRFTLTPENLLDQAMGTTLCSGGSFVVSALVEPEDADELTVESAPVTPTGCP